LRCGEKIRQLRQKTIQNEDDEEERTRIVYFCAKCQATGFASETAFASKSKKTDTNRVTVAFSGTAVSDRLCAMRELSSFGFFLRAIWADIKQSRRWKIVTVSYALIGVVRLALWILTKWSPADLLAPWSGKVTAIFILAFFCLGLILALIAVVDGARRLHLKAIGNFDKQIADAKADFESRTKNLEALSEVYGRAYQLNRQFSPEVERPTPEAVRHLAERLRKVLWACYGPAGTETFTRGGEYYSVTVPEDESKHSEWAYNTYLRLGDLIKEESPKQERLLPANIPDAAFRD